MNFREIMSRLTGFSTPVGGISWNPPEAERAIARRVLVFLEDRRVLYAVAELERPEYCIQSILGVRQKLTDELGALDSSSPLAQSLRAMRAACRQFLEDVGAGRRTVNRIEDFSYPAEHWEFINALGKLRGIFGLHVAQIAVQYNLEVEGSLESILPASTSDDVDTDDRQYRLKGSTTSAATPPSKISPVSDSLVSPLASVCREVHSELLHETSSRAYRNSEWVIMPKVRDEETIGAAGEEAYYHNVRQFPSGALVGLVGVWPGHQDEVYAVVFDEKWPEYFGLLYRKFSSSEEAQEAWMGLGSVDDRGEEQAKRLIEEGWQELFPSREAN